MQYWDQVLYPSFRATIRGQYYGFISQDDMDEECFNLARRAIATFKFPKISTEYTTFHAIRDKDNNIQEVSLEDYPDAIPHAYFNEDVGYEEIEVIIAWMKVYWAEMQISNADNFEELYTDVNIKSYSRANAVEKNTKLMAEYRAYAKDLENRYSRVNDTRKPSLGDVNEDDE